MSGVFVLFVDKELAKRFEGAEGDLCVQFAEARRRLFGEDSAATMRCGGTFVSYDGVDSPMTQTFALGIFEEATETVLGEIESFFAKRNAPVQHEVSPFAGIATLDLLASRGYKPVEIDNVLSRTVEKPDAPVGAGIEVKKVGEDDKVLWGKVNACGWTHEHPELLEFMSEIGAIAAEQKYCVSFLADYEGTPGAAGSLYVRDGVALFIGASTVPELRRRGLQSALFHERMRYAVEQGCDLAMVVAQPGSDSQRNAERNGFRVAYTRTKWKLETVADIQR